MRDKIEDVTQQRQEYNLLNADEVRRIGDTQALWLCCKLEFWTQRRFR
jgi:hypothetical protein